MQLTLCKLHSSRKKETEKEATKSVKIHTDIYSLFSDQDLSKQHTTFCYMSILCLNPHKIINTNAVKVYSEIRHASTELILIQEELYVNLY